MAVPGVPFPELVRDLELEVLTGEASLEGVLTSAEVSRPGLELTGYYKHFTPNRVLVFGTREVAYLDDLSREIRLLRLYELFLYPIPLVLIAGAPKAVTEIVEVAKRFHKPVLQTSRPTNRFLNHFVTYLETRLAPRKTVHGTMMDVFGVGILILGESGIGKSETALELIKRGHRLVADDIVTVRRVAEHTLIGQADDLVKYHMEVRGIGIVDVKALFGHAAVSEAKKIEFVIQLEAETADTHYDRLGLARETHKILDVEVPKIMLPVRSGRNISVMIEVSAINEHMRLTGHHSAQLFLDTLFAKKMMGDAGAGAQPGPATPAHTTSIPRP